MKSYHGIWKMYVVLGTFTSFKLTGNPKITQTYHEFKNTGHFNYLIFEENLIINYFCSSITDFHNTHAVL